MNRCVWANASPLEQAYHDNEWGVPVHDDRLLFEFLVLEGAQAGLSWSTILRKRAGYRKAFDNFSAATIAAYPQQKVEQLLAAPEIVRNRLKITATINNARLFLNLQERYGSFDAYIWQFVSGKTIQNRWLKQDDIPTHTPESDAMSKDLKQHGFSFVGPTICYAFMQAVGMVNDHTCDCFRYAAITEMA